MSERDVRRKICGVTKQIRTALSDVRGRCPNRIDDGDIESGSVSMQIRSFCQAVKTNPCQKERIFRNCRQDKQGMRRTGIR